MEKSNSSPELPCLSNFLAFTIARFTSNSFALLPGIWRVSKVVPARNLYSMVELMLIVCAVLCCVVLDL